MLILRVGLPARVNFPIVDASAGYGADDFDGRSTMAKKSKKDKKKDKKNKKKK